MKRFDRHFEFYRLFFTAVILYLFVVSFWNLYRYTSSPTDENWFRNPPSRLYITRDVPVLSRGSISFHPLPFIRVGDLLISINKVRLDSVQAVFKILSMIPIDSVLSFKIFRPTLNKYFTCSVRRGDIPSDFLRLIPPVAYVFEVIQGGASDRAGMQKGDLIYRINGESFKGAFETDGILRRGQAGKAIDYDIIRNNRLKTLHVILASFGIRVSLLILFLCGLIYMTTGAFLLLSRPQIRATQLLGCGLLLIGFFLTVVISRRDISIDLFARVRDITMSGALFFGAALWSNSSYYFPEEQPRILSHRWILWVSPILAFLLSIRLILTQSEFLIYGVFLIMGYNIVVNIWGRKSKSDRYKRIARIPLISCIFAFLSTILIAFLLIRTERAQYLGFIGIPMALIPLAYLCSILHYGLLDITLRVRRNIQYVFFSFLWGVVLAGGLVWIILFFSRMEFHLPKLLFTGNLIEVLNVPLSPQERQPIERVILMVLTIGVTFLFWRIGRLGQRWINKKFYRSKYDYHRAANELAQVMSTTLDIHSLARGIAKKLSELMHLKKAGVLFFRNELVTCCQEIYSLEEQELKDFRFSIDSDAIRSLKKFDRETNIEYFPEKIREPLHRQGFLYVIPIRSKQKLIGILMVGEKLSESTFHKEDLEFLSTVATQASVAIENAFLYEELSEQERLKHELDIARQIQMASLPQQTPRVEGLDIAGRSIPALEVGGDYFDYLNDSPDEVTVIVGDVSGKGTSAALYMSKVQGIFRSLHTFNLSPKELFARANQILFSELDKKYFVTAIGATFNIRSRKLILARAGHLPLFYFQASLG